MSRLVVLAFVGACARGQRAAEVSSMSWSPDCDPVLSGSYRLDDEGIHRIVVPADPELERCWQTAVDFVEYARAHGVGKVKGGFPSCDALYAGWIGYSQTGFAFPKLPPLTDDPYLVGSKWDTECTKLRAEALGAYAPRDVPIAPADDSDLDGVKGSADGCPTAVEDIDGFEDDDGCPELDNDHDGIIDEQDKCALYPETQNGTDDTDGCPDTASDGDGDGVGDDVDKCPRVIEDMDRFEDADGCPDLDNDHDGLVDAQDRCPNNAETLNGFQDGDGCPD